MNLPATIPAARPADRGPVPGGHNAALESLRGLAALGVVIVHLNAFGFTTLPPALAQLGALGVDVFFCLSGFLIARCVLVPAVFDGRRYLEHRARRILPNYFICILFVLALSDARSLLHESAGHQVANLTTHLTLTHAWFEEYRASIVGPMWTLSHEWWFYMFMLAVAAWMRSARWPAIVAALAATAIVARLGLAYGWWQLPGQWNHPLCMLDQFAIGVAGAVFARRFETPAPRRLAGVLVVVGAAASIWAFWWCHRIGLKIDAGKNPGVLFGEAMMRRFYQSRTSAVLFNPALAAGVTLMIVGFWLGPVNHSRALRWTPLPWMGKVSYSTYLWHMPIVLCFARAARRLPPDSPWANPWAACLLVVAVIYGFSALAWRLFEVPWIRSRREAGKTAGRGDS